MSDGTEMIEEEEEAIETAEESRTPTEYMILVPATACRQDLVDLKTYLEGVTPGSIQIFIDIQGQKKDTKIAVQDVGVVNKWVRERGWE